MIPNYLQKELLILFFIINKEKTTINEISNNLNINKRLVKKNIYSINNHALEAINLESFLSSSNTGFISINPVFEEHSLLYAYQIKLYLLKQHSIFNYCVLLTTQVIINEEDILNHLHISKTYLNKLTYTLNEEYKKFGFQIEKKEKNYYLNGNEINIRLFSYLFLKETFQSIEWPFKNNKNIIKNIITKNTNFNILDDSIIIFITIINNRLEKDFTLKNIHNENIKNALTEIGKLSNIDISNNIFNKNNNEICKIENLYLIFFIHIFIPSMIKKTIKIKFGEKFFKTQNIFYTNTKNILLKNQKKTYLKKEKLYLFSYYLNISNILYLIIGDPIIHFISVFNPPINTNIKNNYLKFLNQIKYNLYNSIEQKKVILYLDISKNFLASYSIENKLLTLYNPNTIKLTTNYKDADLIITDKINKNINNKIFYFDIQKYDNSFNKLTTIINKIYLNN